MRQKWGFCFIYFIYILYLYFIYILYIYFIYIYAGAPVLHPQRQERVLQPLSPQRQAVARSSKVRVFCQSISWTRPKVFLFCSCSNLLHSVVYLMIGDMLWNLEVINKNWISDYFIPSDIYMYQYIFYLLIYTYTFLGWQLVSIHHFICPTGSFIWPWPQSAGAQKWKTTTGIIIQQFLTCCT